MRAELRALFPDVIGAIIYEYATEDWESVLTSIYASLYWIEVEICCRGCMAGYPNCAAMNSRQQQYIRMECQTILPGSGDIIRFYYMCSDSCSRRPFFSTPMEELAAAMSSYRPMLPSMLDGETLERIQKEALRRLARIDAWQSPT